MIAIRRACCVLSGLLFAGSVASSQDAQSTKPPAPPAPTRPAVDLKKPDGATIKCKDGSWAPKGADASACDAHRGLAYRLPEITTPPAAKPRPDAGQARPTPPNAPEVVGGARDASGSARSSADIAERPAAAPPPSNAVMLCRDGTYLSGERVASRCDSHGGLTGFLPARRP
ncbi:MAG: hypothetical protein P3B98_13160 [Gemmatimonadota bacterium]|nr:hypothetical protein [Gemmatimonadota bacterium]